MSTNSSSLTTITERRYIKSPSFSRLNKEISFRKPILGQLNSKVNEHVKQMFNDNEINLQISKQMRQIDQLLREIRPQIQQIVSKNNERPIMEILIDLQQRIKRKNNLLTQINNENKELKSTNKKSLKLKLSDSLNSQQYNPEQGQKTFKLAHQLKKQREELLKVKNQHLQKNRKLEQIKNQVFKVQFQYIEKCKKTKEKPLTYEMFKCLNEQKKKQLNNELKIEQRKRNKRQTLKQMLKSNSFQNSPRNKPEKNFKDIVNRKKIAEQALKTARKKYSQQISEFHAKLQFLRQQDLALVQTLRQKQLQFYTLQNKFNQSRKNYLASPSNRSSQNAKLQNTLRFRGQHYDIDELRKTKKINKFLSPDQLI